jgi:hypothetical protein
MLESLCIFTKRTHVVWIADFRISDCHENGGHRPPLQEFAKRTHALAAPVQGYRKIRNEAIPALRALRVFVVQKITKRTQWGNPKEGGN